MRGQVPAAIRPSDLPVALAGLAGGGVGALVICR